VLAGAVNRFFAGAVNRQRTTVNGRLAGLQQLLQVFDGGAVIRSLERTNCGVLQGATSRIGGDDRLFCYFQSAKLGILKKITNSWVFFLKNGGIFLCQRIFR
jgi:hypothetical protein